MLQRVLEMDVHRSAASRTGAASKHSLSGRFPLHDRYEPTLEGGHDATHWFSGRERNRRARSRSPTSGAGAEYPSKPVTVIAVCRGLPTDVVARLVTEHMGRTLGTTFVVENVGGAGGSIGMTRAALAQPDGYIIAVGNMGTQSVAPALYPNLKYDPAKSFAQIGIVNYTPQAVVSKKALATTTLKDFIAYVKGKGTAISYGHAGVGSISHVAGLVFNAKFGLTPNMIPYRGTGPVLNRLVAGRSTTPSTSRSTSSRKSRPAPSRYTPSRRRRRYRAFPDVPTTKEAGEDFIFSAWSLRRMCRRRSSTSLSAALSKALDDATVKERYGELGSSAPRRAPSAGRRDCKNWSKARSPASRR